MDYCSIVWSFVPDSSLVRLQRIQNKCMRVILDCDFRSHRGDMLNDLSFMSIKQRIIFNRCILMWKIVHGKSPQHLSANFTLNSNVSTYNTRSSNFNIYHDRVHSNSFNFKGTKSWNDLPHEMKSVTILSSFKRKCKEHILKKMLMY